jgi:hypothetical protein
MLRRFLAAFGLSFLVSFAGGSVVFFVLRFIIQGYDGHTPIAYWFRMTMYPDGHPFQYAFIVAVTFALLTTIWTVWLSARLHRMRWLQIAAIIALTVEISGVLGGVLYMFHDMQAGYFPDRDIMMDRFIWGAGTGAVLGPIIVAFSVPLNALCFAIAYVTASFTQRRFGS